MLTEVRKVVTLWIGVTQMGAWGRFLKCWKCSGYMFENIPSHLGTYLYASYTSIDMNGGNTAVDTLSGSARGPSRSSPGDKESGQSSQMMLGPGSGERDRQMTIEKVGKGRRGLPVCGRWWEEMFTVRQRVLAWTIGCWMLVAFIVTEHTGSGTAWSRPAKQKKLWEEEKLGVARTGHPLSPPIRGEVYNLNLSHLYLTGSGKAGSGQSEQVREDSKAHCHLAKGIGILSLDKNCRGSWLKSSYFPSARK